MSSGMARASSIRGFERPECAAASALAAALRRAAPGSKEGNSTTMSDQTRHTMDREQSHRIALTGARLIDGVNPAQDDMTVVVRGQRIDSVVPDEQYVSEAGDESVPVAGRQCDAGDGAGPFPFALRCVRRGRPRAVPRPRGGARLPQHAGGVQCRTRRAMRRHRGHRREQRLCDRRQSQGSDPGRHRCRPPATSPDLGRSSPLASTPTTRTTGTSSWVSRIRGSPTRPTV